MWACKKKHQALLDFHRKLLFSLRAFAYTGFFGGFIVWDYVFYFQWYTNKKKRERENKLSKEQLKESKPY